MIFALMWNGLPYCTGILEPLGIIHYDFVIRSHSLLTLCPLSKYYPLNSQPLTNPSALPTATIAPESLSIV